MGRERERHKVPYGATLTVKADQTIKAGTHLANWDPLTRPIITEFAGHGEVRERGRRPDGGQAGGRSDRPVDPGGDRPQAPWRCQGACVRRSS